MGQAMDKNNRLNKQIIFWNHRSSFIIGTILLAITVAIGFSYLYQRIYSQKKLIHHLVQTSQNKETEILNLIQTYKNYLKTLSKNPELLALISRMEQTFVRGRIADYKNTPEEYKKLEASLDLLLSHHPAGNPFKDLFLIKQDGTIFYVNKGEILNANITEAQFAHSALTQSFERVKLTLTMDISEFEVDPLIKEPSLFILHPIMVENKFLAVLALELDETYFYKLIQDSKLGSTGDIFLTKHIGVDRVLFLSPLRSYSNVAFKKISTPDKDLLTPGRRAAMGDKGFGRTLDAFGKEVVASWRFVPQVNWGLVVKIDASEINAFANQLFYFMLLFILLCLIYVAYILILTYGIKRIKQLVARFFSPKVIRLLLFFGFMFSLISSVILMWNHYSTHTAVFKKTKEYGQSKVKSQADFIIQNLSIVEKITKMIAKDLQTGLLKKEDVGIRITRELKGSSNLDTIAIAYAPFMYDPQKRLYGLIAQRRDGNVSLQEITTDYMIPGSEKDPEADWYNKTIAKGAFWSEPYFNKNNKMYEIRFSMPFYFENAKEPTGVVALTYDLEKIIDKIRSIEVGKSGFGIIISSLNGTFIYHPLSQYVQNKVSLFDVAREQNNASLQTIADDMLKGKSGFGSYIEKNTKLDYWIIYEHIPSLQWTVGAIFSEEALNLPYEQLHILFIWIFISFVIALLFLALLFAHVEQWNLKNARKVALASTLIFAGALIAFWSIIREESYHIRQDAIVIRDETGLDQYIEFLKVSSFQRSEQSVTVIPTGLLLYTLNFSDATKLSVSGYMWQKIKKELKIVPGVRFPEATEVTLKEVLRKEEGDYEIIGWNLGATFLQKHRYSWFPFDRVHVDIIIAPADFTSNIMLVPDFTGYQSLDVDPLPGITNEILIPGFALERSFFSYLPIAQYDEVGLETLRKKSGDVRLHYNILLERKLTNPLIIFFLPLLIILFSIYAVLLITFRGRNLISDVFTALSSYTAIFFTLVILHQTLRGQYQVGELLYVEYFFFFTYITILLLILYSILFRVSNFASFIHTKISPYLRYFYWTIQFGFWFIITMIMFYKLR